MITSTPTLDRFDEWAIGCGPVLGILLGLGVLLAYPLIWWESRHGRL